MGAWDELAQLDQLGGPIRARRTELGWTQSELAERSGVPQADISRIENDRLDARWSTLQRAPDSARQGSRASQEPCERSTGQGRPEAVEGADSEHARDAHSSLFDITVSDAATPSTPGNP